MSGFWEGAESVIKGSSMPNVLEMYKAVSQKDLLQLRQGIKAHFANARYLEKMVDYEIEKLNQQAEDVK